MIKEMLYGAEKRMTNEHDFVPPKDYVPEDPEKAKMIKTIGSRITDRMLQQMVPQAIKYQDAEYWMLNELLSKEEAKFMLGFKKRRVCYTPEYLAKEAGVSMEKAMEIIDHLCWYGLVESARPGADKKMEYFMPPFVPGSAEHMMENQELLDQYPVMVPTFFNTMTQAPLEPVNQMVPMGAAGVGMHIIPIESSINAINKAVDVEKMSHWLNKYHDQIAIGSCACRSLQTYRGEGDGSIPGEYCFCLGDLAEFAVNTGRGRYISYEEAVEISDRLERHGYIHQITNIDGEDKIFAICNCAPGVCCGFRTSQLFNTPNLSRSPYVAHVDMNECVACGKCVEVCPVGAVKLGRRIPERLGEFEYPKAELPDEHLWGQHKWNQDFRQTAKENCYEVGTSPCKAACPAHIAVQGYIQMAKEGRYMDALKLIKQDNPLPAVCGAICNRKCEEACTRNKIDEAVAIDEIKKFIAVQELNAETRYVPVCENAFGEKWDEFPIAVIGSGPSGISCAYYLREKGYPVTIFEKEKRAGGMLMNGIPNFRLEKDVLEAEIDVLREMGVEFKYGVEVGKDITLDDLRKEGYKGFYVAIGAQGGRKANIPGEDAGGVQSGVQFLKDVNLGNVKEIKGKTVVIGGGNVAIDVARTAVRLGSNVELVYRRSIGEMPADPTEIEEAIKEGVKITNGWAPLEVVKYKNGNMKSIKFKAYSDDRTPYQPGIKEGDEYTVNAANLLVSIGQAIEWGELLEGSKVELNKNNTAKADSLTLQTAQEDVFVGGDVYTGPKFAIDAIAAGKEAAESLHRFVHWGQSLTMARDLREFPQMDTDDIWLMGYDSCKRQVPGRKNGNPTETFADLRKPLTEEQIKKEASRCLGCGRSVVDENRCVGCGLCTSRCEFDAIHLERERPDCTRMIPIEDMMTLIAPYSMKRAVKIAINGVKKANDKIFNER